MEAALDEMEIASELPADRHWSPLALGGLIPAPEPSLDDTDPDATIERARKAWPAPDTFSDLITRWAASRPGPPTGRRRPRQAGPVRTARLAAHWTLVRRPVRQRSRLPGP
jgi:hypothetical protein